VSLILPWVVFPLVLAALGLGWGRLVELASGGRLEGALLIPVGFAAALVVAGTITAFSAIAPAAVTVTALGGGVGLVLALRARRWPAGWALLAALGALLAYGAPVLLSGQATFLGFIKLDDTGTWFNIIDNVMSHGHSVAGLAESTYRLQVQQPGPAYPLGAFMLPGVARALTGIDIAWVFQPYLACCGAAVALSVYVLLGPLVRGPRLRALLAFLGAQPALLYGYSLWGGIKEMTAAFLLATGAALAAALMARRPASWRELIPLGLTAGALIQTLGAGAAGWVAPALLCLVAVWLWRERSARRGRAVAASGGWLIAITAVCVLPVWVVLSDFLSNKGKLLNELFSSGQSTHTKLGNLIHPLSGWQLAGIWPVGDFRLTAPTVQSALWIGLTLISALFALFLAVRRRSFGVPFYVAVALIGSGVVYFSGGTPWVTGKSLAFSSPAVLVAALAGAGMLWGARRAAGPRGLARRIGAGFVIAALGAGVLWSNALAYHDVTLAPRAQLRELQHIGKLVAGKGPTFMNMYEVYADRHFLREGAPVEPAEYRTVTLPLREGNALTEAAWADIDSFPLSTLETYRSIITRRSPAESRPPSIYGLVYSGRYYQLWQRPAQPTRQILDQVPLGESTTRPFCGKPETGASRPLCSMNPVAVPSCALVQQLGRRAASEDATLVAYQRPEPIALRGDEVRWPAGWFQDVEEHTLSPIGPGSAIAHIRVTSAQRYELWLGGSFNRGFEVSVDGRHVGTVRNELNDFEEYVPVADVFLTAGVHAFTFTYPHASLAPGSGWGEYTYLAQISLEPLQSPPRRLFEVAPAQARTLCERQLDWIEIVR
jgi:hypothetical protein